tara:strand:+ start:1759 stop:2064 length:306 start_codon:yes stop_codon:yes gene_type:complete
VKLDESTQIKANAAFAAKLVLGIATAVWSYSVIVNRINALELEIVRLKDDIHMNSEFRTKWPRGELGALPDDAEQNMRLNFYERELEKVKVIVDELRFDKP